jgi:hypothetical protein
VRNVCNGMIIEPGAMPYLCRLFEHRDSSHGPRHRELTVVGILESLDTHTQHTGQDYVYTILIFFSSPTC